MLTKSGVKLLDFGLARPLAPERQLGRDRDGASHGVSCHDGRGDSRHASVHGSRAARRQARRRTDGHLRARLRAPRDGDGEAGVRGHEPGHVDLRHPEQRPASDLVAPADDAGRLSTASCDAAWRRIPSAASRMPATSRSSSPRLGAAPAPGRDAAPGAPIRRGSRMGWITAGVLLALLWGLAPRPAAEFLPGAGSQAPPHDPAARRYGLPGNARDLSRRPDARLRRDERRRQRPALSPPARFPRIARLPRDGGRRISVLVAGQQVDRIFCPFEAEAPRRGGRRAGHALRGGRAPRRIMELEGRNHRRCQHRRCVGSSGRGRRSRDCAPAVEAGRLLSLAMLPPGWRPLRLLRVPGEYRGPGHPRRLARVQGVDSSRRRGRRCYLRRARPSPVPAWRPARCAALRRQPAASRRRPFSHRGEHPVGWFVDRLDGRVRLEHGRSRLSDWRLGRQPPAVVRPVGPRAGFGRPGAAPTGSRPCRRTADRSRCPGWTRKPWPRASG